MSLTDTIKQQLITARKNGQVIPRTVLSTALGRIENAGKQTGAVLNDALAFEQLKSMLGEIDLGLTQRRQAKRDLGTLLDERALITSIMATYTPLSDDELRSAVNHAVRGGAKNIGAIMTSVRAHFGVRFDNNRDGARASTLARVALAEQAPPAVQLA